VPTLYDGLQYFDFLRGWPAVYLILLTTGLLLALRDWRASLVVLTAQFLIVGLLYADVLAAHLAYMKVIVGLFSVLILHFTGRQVNWARLPVDLTQEEAALLRRERLARLGSSRLNLSPPVRSALAAAAILAVWLAGRPFSVSLPIIPEHLDIAVYALVFLGLLNVSTTAEPFLAGVGLITFLTGFGLMYAALEQAEAMLAVLALVELSVAVVVSYLTQARYTFPALWERLEKLPAASQPPVTGSDRE
jgi:hypothetical protein